MNPLTQTINQRKMNERELEAGVSGTKNSWHMEYKDSAWIFLGGLPYEMTEGDVICMFSQYGEVVHINLIRDHGTGKSKGFGFLCYMDQRSTILAVDNLNGVKVLSRMIRVDHVHQYKLPKDLEKLDQDKRKLFEEGCAPKEIDIEFSESSEEEFVTKPKKEKKKKKQKRRRRHSTSSESESDSEDDRRKKDKNKMKDRDHSRDRKQELLRNNRDKVKQEEKSLEERLKDMADYVRSGETRAGENKRMSAKDMFVKEDRRMRDRSGSVKRVSMKRSRTRSKDRRARSRSSQRREHRRRSRSYERQKSKNYRSSSRGRERQRRESSSSGREYNERRRR